MHTKVNVVSTELFKKSYVNAVVISTLGILKIHTQKRKNTSKMRNKRSYTIIIWTLLLLTPLELLYKNRAHNNVAILCPSNILTVNNIGSIKTWDKPSCLLSLSLVTVPR